MTTVSYMYLLHAINKSAKLIIAEEPGILTEELTQRNMTHTDGLVRVSVLFDG